MWARIILTLFCLLMIGSAIHFAPSRPRSLFASRANDGPHLKLMTWNIGYAELEDDSRAHTKDLQTVAETVLRNDPDAVALQELTGPEQLRILLGYLHGKYRGAVAPPGSSDRVEAVLVKDRDARFENLAVGEKYCVATAFHLRPQSQELVLASAHADAFSSVRRRVYTGEVVDWARARERAAIVFIGGDFNFELDSKDESHFYSDNVKHDSEAYSYLLKYFRDLGRDAGYTAVNDRRIDYVFGPTETVSVRRVEVLRGAGTEQMDHWPLLVEVAL
ncbi:MAG TPA: endonuclease/exonuclease/phosphatase family protein [Pyrinomonadaceae bacterium]|nr:endonuclease/exonuclease/phosphatase family protein [Pyrinomonadaceae bacterium]